MRRSVLGRRGAEGRMTEGFSEKRGRLAENETLTSFFMEGEGK
jgi:hypothetical protein